MIRSEKVQHMVFGYDMKLSGGRFKHSNRLLAAGMSLLLACNLAGCGGNSAAAPSGSAAGAASEAAAASAGSEAAGSTDVILPPEAANSSENGAGGATNPHVKPGQYPGVEVPSDLDLEDDAGNKLKLSDFKGKYVVVSFGTTWCPSCKAELGILQKISEKYKDKSNLVFLPLTLLKEDKQTKEMAQMFYESEGLTLQRHYVDQKAVVDAYKLTDIPVLMFIKPDGKCMLLGKTADDKPIYYHVGETEADEMAAMVDKLLAAK
ncbi:TlpA family protein disulfide reductase [Mageeibacillus indolicus]|uniref:TlpA family protein disulfide reductase n=1 Tax=Mageeibacillus indolicus TaxID=884684 RepID=UPI0004DD4B28|nr:TlpA disulfide reductase family protein [Mageeibacillus indolicus]KFA57703.1 hypothetical protein HMPREF1632_01610 [Mageeibacillus indolicus 0009-5]